MSEKKDDLTRIEDLSEFLHQEDDEQDQFDDLQSKDSDDSSDETPEGFSSEKTDPNIEIDTDALGAFSDSEEPDPNEFNSYDSTQSFDTSDFNSESSFDDDNSFEDSSGFGEDSEFGADDNFDSSGFEDESDFSGDNSFEQDSEVFDSDDTSFEEATDFDDSDGFQDLNENEDTTTFTNDAENNSQELEQTPSQLSTDTEEINEEQTLDSPPPIAVTNEKPAATETIKVQDNLDEIKNFAKNISYGDASAEGNPPFSLIIENIKYEEDSQAILQVLLEHGFANETNKEQIQNSLKLGSILISRISEYSAIYMAHKLRAYSVEIKMGLTDEINPPKSYKSNDRGLVSKRNVFQNRSSSQLFESGNISVNDILLSTATQLDTYQITQYLGIITESQLIDLNDYQDEDKKTESESESSAQFEQQIDQIVDETKSLNFGLASVYKNLANQLRPQALKLKANAIIGINYSLVALPKNENAEALYQLICTGNAAWVENK